MEVVFGAFCLWLSAVLGPTQVALSVKSHLQAWSLLGGRGASESEP